MSAAADFAELLQAGGAPEAAVERLARYCALLERWSKTHNLVRVASREELVRRHVMESLAALPLLAERGRLEDVGSGAGLPGVPLLAARVGWSGRLIEPRGKRAAFLKMVVRELALAAEVVEARYEDVRGPEAVTVITARALGGWAELLGWARNRLAPEGFVLLWVTRATEAELTRLPGWRVVSSALPATREGRLTQLRPCST